MSGSYELAASASKSSGFSSSTLIIILVVVVAFYLLLIRPQQRRKQQAAKQQNTLAPGALVRTTAGMYATVVDVDGDDVVLEIAPGIEVRYMRRAVMEVVSPGPVTEETVEDDDVSLAEEAEETGDPGYYAAEGEDGDAEDTDETADAGPHSEMPADAESTAYEQATGFKKD
jgi:preprotein translocase subunit YajC